MSLKGKKILITGAAKRIGREIAWRLAESGAQILIHYHRSATEARALQKAINNKFKTETRLYRADLQNDRQILRLADQVWRDNRHIDALINNASTFFPTPLGQAKKSDFEKLFNVNVLAPLLLIDRLGTKMKKRGSGHIINIGDHSQMKPSVRFLTYTASKAALASLNQGFARALAPEVQVNHLLLGPILWPEDFSLKGKKSVLEKTLLKKAGNPQDIARMVEYLLLHGDYMTGCMVHIDGGASLA